MGKINRILILWLIQKVEKKFRVNLIEQSFSFLSENLDPFNFILFCADF